MKKKKMPEVPDGQKKLTPKQNFLQSFKFLLFSISAGIIQTVTFTLLNEVVKAPEWLSYLAALILSVVYNFTLNRKFTFKSANNVPVAMLKVACFYLVFTPLSTWWVDALTVKAGLNEYLVLAGTMIVNFVTEFFYDRFIVFGKSINTNELGKKELEKSKNEAQQNHTSK